ncbi:hypothetical protein [Stenotrophomonas phage vB_SmaS_P15]|uniref:Uncharacterized protein n=1 Tax=Stenotrophomonas phage vB_SmaS_P15 TaxID=2894592 RepID=A0AAE8YHJ0_9CAUD|nr:hypothetical protein [Stenotrophomonas phage vB_SmaS_P15]
MSKSASRTRLYLFAYFHAGTGKFHDMLWHTTVTSHLDHVDDKTIDKVCALEHHEALLAAIPEAKREDSGTTNLRGNAEERRTYGAVSRRALARRLRDKLQASIGTYWNIKIIEVGDFSRETRPVKHWNIERKRRLRGTREAWVADTAPYLRGYEVREQARADAKAQQDSWNDSDSDRYEYRFTAVPVYA